jgi:transcriptional regulator with XRE-family HTH domain
MRPEWFAGRLRELREAAGLTQQQLADAAGLKLAGIRNLEQGRTFPEWPSVLSLCTALGVGCESFTTPPTAREKPGRGRPAKASANEPPEPKRSRGRPKKIVTD